MRRETNEKIKSEFRPPVYSADGDNPAARRRRANASAGAPPGREHPAQTDAGASRTIAVTAQSDRAGRQISGGLAPSRVADRRFQTQPDAHIWRGAVHSFKRFLQKPHSHKYANCVGDDLYYSISAIDRARREA